MRAFLVLVLIVVAALATGCPEPKPYDGPIPVNQNPDRFNLIPPVPPVDAGSGDDAAKKNTDDSP
jgi:hypothetical protein